MASTDAMDVTNAEIQDQIANSLLGDDLDPGAQYESNPTDTGEGYEQPETTDDAFAQINAELAEQTQEILDESEQSLEEEAAPEPVEFTPEQIQESLQQLDQDVETLGLADPGESAVLASALGVDPANSAALGNVMAKTTLSALNVLESVGNDFSKIGPVVGPGAEAFKNEFERGVLGIDPRTSPADPSQLATLMFAGAASVIEAYRQHGLDASLDQINQGETSQQFADALLAIYGGGGQAQREAALALADAGAQFIGQALRKIMAARAEEPAPRRSRAQSSSRRAARFETNNDIFSEGLMEYLQREGSL